MNSNSINRWYNIMSLFTFGLVWYKSGIWYYGFLGLIACFILPGLFNGIWRGLILNRMLGYKDTLMYPGLFYQWALLLILYFFFYNH